MEIVYEFDGQYPTIAKTPDTVHSFQLTRDRDRNDRQIYVQMKAIPVRQGYENHQLCDNMDPNRVERWQRFVAFDPNHLNSVLKPVDLDARLYDRLSLTLPINQIYVETKEYALEDLANCNIKLQNDHSV